MKLLTETELELEALRLCHSFPVGGGIPLLRSTAWRLDNICYSKDSRQRQQVVLKHPLTPQGIDLGIYEFLEIYISN